MSPHVATFDRSKFALDAPALIGVQTPLERNVHVYHMTQFYAREALAVHQCGVWLHGARLALLRYTNYFPVEEAVNAGLAHTCVPDLTTSAPYVTLSSCGYNTATTARVLNKTFATIGLCAHAYRKNGDIWVSYTPANGDGAINVMINEGVSVGILRDTIVPLVGGK